MAKPLPLFWKPPAARLPMSIPFRKKNGQKNRKRTDEKTREPIKLPCSQKTYHLKSTVSSR